MKHFAKNTFFVNQ